MCSSCGRGKGSPVTLLKKGMHNAKVLFMTKREIQREGGRKKKGKLGERIKENWEEEGRKNYLGNTIKPGLFENRGHAIN